MSGRPFGFSSTHRWNGGWKWTPLGAVSHRPLPAVVALGG